MSNTKKLQMNKERKWKDKKQSFKKDQTDQRWPDN